MKYDILMGLECNHASKFKKWPKVHLGPFGSIWVHLGQCKFLQIQIESTSLVFRSLVSPAQGGWSLGVLKSWGHSSESLSNILHPLLLRDQQLLPAVAFLTDQLNLTLVQTCILVFFRLIRHNIVTTYPKMDLETKPRSSVSIRSAHRQAKPNH